MILVAIKGFIYAIAVDIYVFRLAFSGILHCVLHHFTVQLIKENEEKSKLVQTD